MSGPSVYLTWPSLDLLKFPPDSHPPALLPPVQERTFRSPFGIDPATFNYVLKWQIPVTFAIVYILSVFLLNAYNRNKGNKPWYISTTRPFKAFVLVHNIVLAAYSLATFLAMLRAIAHTWPGLNNEHGAAGMADALCKINGPRGLGDAATYNSTLNIWETKNQAIKLLPTGNPDPTDVGRLWNEGLAFWGWLFYVSKFYEVLDTFIIISKGKRSPTLQTYHHAGAMLCMWAGIRYMSPPIWMFVFINSGIHAMMYTYFTLAALHIRVPSRIKRTLTVLQIMQFVFGASYAAAHLFVQYDIPVNTPYQVAHIVQRAVSSVSSVAASVTSDVSSFIESPTATASMGAIIKKFLLRAAGEEGLAERAAHNKGQLIAQPLAEKIEQFEDKIEHRYETKWRIDWTKVNCIDTSGQAFAIYLNLLYLAPLTGLFVRFFYKAYTARGRKGSHRKPSEAFKDIKDAARQAEEDMEKKVEEAGKRAEDEVRHRGSEVRDNVSDLHYQLREDVKKMKDGNYGSRRVSDRVHSFEKQVKSAAEKAKNSASGTPRKGSPKKTANGSGQETPKRQNTADESAIEEDEPDQKQESKDEISAESESKPKTDGAKPDTDGSKDEPEVKQENDDAEEDKENQPPSAETKKVKAEDESAEKQDANTEDSQATRPGPETYQPSGQKANKRAPHNKKASDDSTDAPGPSKTAETEKVKAEDESEAKQDENMADSQALRPGAEDDSDAMGKSGVDIGDEKKPSGNEKKPSGNKKKPSGNAGS